MRDERVRSLIQATPLDVQEGGENGFYQAIELAQPSLGDSRLGQERDLLTDWMSYIARGMDNQVVFVACGRQWRRTRPVSSRS